MARPINIAPKNLRELQKAMKYMETAIEPRDVKPVLAGALMIFRAKALEILRRLTKRSVTLPDGWERIEDNLTVKEGKSQTIATAFAKVFRKASPQAIWVEFGHKMIGHKPDKKDTGKFVTANPFFRTGLDMTRKAILKFVRDGVRALLQVASTRAGFQDDGTTPPDDLGGVI